MARALPSILPPMSPEEALEVTKVYSVSGKLPPGTPLIRQRPFRAPHHTTSHAGLVGGGRMPRPGEISLAHRGVLFLDELPEFPSAVLEVLRQPLEDRVVTISRAAGTLTFPANFTLVAAQNPCSCGYFGDSERQCICPPSAVARYSKRVSGPLLDRIDMHVDVPRVKLRQADQRAARRAVRADSGARGGRAGTAAPALRAGNRGSESPDERRHGRRRDPAVVRVGQRGTKPHACGDAPASALGAGVSSCAQAGAHDRGPGAGGADRAGASGGGAAISAAEK